MNPILQARDLRYSYGEKRMALNGVSMDIAQGEKIAVLGSNGAGKSTFFLHLNGVLSPDSGEIRFRDTAITRKTVNELRRHVSIVFQNADDQIIASTVREEVSFGPVNLKLPRDEVAARVEEALDYMNLSAFRDRPPHYLSGGEKKRVSIADVIAMRPELILFDEPTASLDPLNAELLEQVLDRLSAGGKTILLSTHDVDFAYRWAERLVVFHDGRIIADGDPLRVFQDRAVIRQASLKRPMLLDIYEGLAAKGLSTGAAYPRSVQALLGGLPNIG
ncbi:MAG: ABC transporter ATP-binding protein [Oscillospiraceae bacterium]|nr:ABC transporter ATP-binding protein [Oscillospiraceae bacterium]